jgi:hypothetical protein
VNTTRNKKRKVKKFWVVTEEYGVTRAECLDQKPSSAVWWWCPSLGCSRLEGKHLFPTEREAITKAVECVRERYEKDRETLGTLENRLAQIS